MAGEQKVGATCYPLHLADDAATPSPDAGKSGPETTDASNSVGQHDEHIDASRGSGSDASVPVSSDSNEGGAPDGGGSDAKVAAPCDGTVQSDGTCAPAARVIGIAVGGFHACALSSAGTVKCWGRNDSGQLGSPVADQLPPTTVPGLSDVVEIAAGAAHTCARISDGTLHCWGANESGQLGDGTTSSSADATRSVSAFSKAVHVAAGGSMSCIITDAAALRCWGFSGGTGGSQIDGLTPFSDVSLGFDHGCAQRLPSGLQCWGRDAQGQRGDGKLDSNWSQPVDVSIGTVKALSVAAGSFHTCVALADFTAKCWGLDTFSELGDGNVSMPSMGFPAPQTVPGLANVRAVSAGEFFSCALLADATVSCWGRGGRLGDGTMDQHATPTAVASLTNVVELRSGVHDFTCARQTSGSVRCWGAANNYGQLGDGTVANALVPVSVINLP